MTTLSTLRDLLNLALTHTDAPALLRLPVDQRTVEGLARAYLPRGISLHGAGSWWVNPADMLAYPTEAESRCRIDITDPGAAGAILAALRTPTVDLRAPTPIPMADLSRRRGRSSTSPTVPE